MARLIDADALKDNMFDYAPPEMTWDRGDIEHKIDEMHTIPAIPVEWLEQQRDKRRAAAAAHSNISSMTVLEAINVVLELWQKEQEAR